MTKGQGKGPLFFVAGHQHRGRIYGARNPGFPANVIMDDEDRNRLSHHAWSLDGAGYVQRHAGESGAWSKVRLHREVMNALEGSIVDHINGNKLDNRRSNLRITDLQVNGQNRALSSANTSGVHGVSYRKAVDKWYAYAKVSGIMKSLGFYDTFEEAKKVATEYRRKHYAGYVDRV